MRVNYRSFIYFMMAVKKKYIRNSASSVRWWKFIVGLKSKRMPMVFRGNKYIILINHFMMKDDAVVHGLIRADDRKNYNRAILKQNDLQSYVI